MILSSFTTQSGDASQDLIDFEPCDGAISLSRTDLQLQARLVEQLGIDRSPAQSGGWPIFRLVVEPHYMVGEKVGGAESAIAIYLPDSGDAVVEVAKAERSIRGLNSRFRAVPGKVETFTFDVRAAQTRVPVTFARGYLSRDVAVALQERGFERIKRARLPDSDKVTIRLHANTYTITAWRLGYGTRCASAVLHDAEFARSAEGQLATLLVKLAQNKSARFETEKLLRKHLLLDAKPE